MVCGSNIIELPPPRRIGTEGEEMSGEWSQEEDDLLRSLARSGRCLSEIEQKLRRSKSSIRARATKFEVAIARDRNASQPLLNLVRRKK
jgi:hypothetical protein